MAATVDEQTAGRTAFSGQEFRQAAGSFATGVTVVTSRDGEHGYGQAAQDVLGKDGNLAPLVRIVELVQLDMVKLAGIEGCAARLLYRAPLPRALNVLDLQA